MTHFDTTSPQLKVIDQVFEAYRSDLNKAASIYSKNFTYKAFPRAAELPFHSREEHIEALGPLLASLAKVEVRVQYRGTAFEHPGSNLPPPAHHS